MYQDKKILAVIPARGGSKGLPGKNIKELCGKPLLCWSIDVARGIVGDEDICVSTDSSAIRKVVELYGLKIPFLRPDVLASDTATTRDVLVHALDFYKTRGKRYDIVLLLQPTSPLRTVVQIKEALNLYTPDIDMVVSVKVSHSPAVLARENENGFLVPVFNTEAGRRQDMERFYEYNGAIYIINVESLYNHTTLNFEKKVKYVMDNESSLDIDNQLDFDFVELIMQKRKI